VFFSLGFCFFCTRGDAEGDDADVAEAAEADEAAEAGGGLSQWIVNGIFLPVVAAW